MSQRPNARLTPRGRELLCSRAAGGMRVSEAARRGEPMSDRGSGPTGEADEEGGVSREPISTEDWKMGYSKANPPKGCNKGCLLLVLPCVALDVAAAFMVCEIARFMAWLVSLMACA